MPALVTLDQNLMDLTHCEMCDCRSEGCDGFVCHGFDAD